MKENVYQTALEYLETAAKAEQNGFSTDKTKKAIRWIAEIKQRAADPEKYRQDKFYKASKDINDLVCFCKDYLDRIKTYLESLGLANEYPCKILYDNISSDEIYYVNTELLYDNDSREEMEYFSRNAKSFQQFAEELNKKYEMRGIRVLFIDGPYIRKSMTYKWTGHGLYTFNEYLKGGE